MAHREIDQARIETLKNQLWSEIKNVQDTMQSYKKDRLTFLSNADRKDLYKVLKLMAKLTDTKICWSDYFEYLMKSSVSKKMMRQKINEIDKTFDWEKFLNEVTRETMDDVLGGAFRDQDVGSDSSTI